MPIRRAAAACASDRTATCIAFRRTIETPISCELRPLRLLTNLREHLRTTRMKVEKFGAVINAVLEDDP